MIDYISGVVAELEPALVVIDCGGVGFEINITLVDYPELQGRERVKLYVHEVIREDARQLYGFLTRESRIMFRLLIGVSGVGPNTGRLIMSSLGVAELESVISGGDERQLKAVKGVGAKTAQRIIVDLKDKINGVSGALIEQSQPAGGDFDEALAALVTLGFTRQQSQKVLKKIYTDYPGSSLENAIRMALKML